MDRTVKLLLGLIAFSLISLNLQLAGFELVGEAKAELDLVDHSMVSDRLRGIERAIGRIDCN